jgi:hypothetical protein
MDLNNDNGMIGLQKKLDKLLFFYSEKMTQVEESVEGDEDVESLKSLLETQEKISKWNDTDTPEDRESIAEDLIKDERQIERLLSIFSEEASEMGIDFGTFEYQSDIKVIKESVGYKDYLAEKYMYEGFTAKEEEFAQIFGKKMGKHLWNKYLSYDKDYNKWYQSLDLKNKAYLMQSGYALKDEQSESKGVTVTLKWDMKTNPKDVDVQGLIGELENYFKGSYQGYNNGISSGVQTFSAYFRDKDAADIFIDEFGGTTSDVEIK